MAATSHRKEAPMSETPTKKPAISIKGATLTKYQPKLIGPKDAQDQVVEMVIQIPIAQVDWTALQHLWGRSSLLSLEGKEDPLPFKKPDTTPPVAEGQLTIDDAMPLYSVRLMSLPMTDGKADDAAEAFIKKLLGYKSVSDLRLDLQDMPKTVADRVSESDAKAIEAKLQSLDGVVELVSWHQEPAADVQGDEFRAPVSEDDVEAVELTGAA